MTSGNQALLGRWGGHGTKSAISIVALGMSSITSNAFQIEPGTIAQGLKRVRPYLNGQLVADSAAPLEIWGHPYYPHYGFAPDEVEVVLTAVGNGPRSKVFGPSVSYDVIADGVTAPAAARRYPEAPNEAMREHTLFSWNAMTTWLEEDELVHTHPRSPYVRIDALASSRHVEVRVGDAVVADSLHPVVLYETGLTPRYYLPQSDVHLELLVPTETQSHCPYKGRARYWSLEVAGQKFTDVVWGYDTPLAESERLAGLVCFWPEKYAELTITVDGVRIGQ